MTNVDGNTAALNQYLKYEDKCCIEEEAFNDAIQTLSDTLFEAYFNCNEAVIAEVDDSLVDTDDIIASMLTAMRDNFTSDGLALRTQYKKYIARACDSIASRYKTMSDIENAYRNFSL